MASRALARLVSDKALPDLKGLVEDTALTTAIVTALISTRASLTSSDLAESVSSSTGRGLTEVNPMVRTIRLLARVQRSLEANADTFVAELTANLAKLSDSQWPPECREKWRGIAPELVRVLSPGSAVYLSVKANDLLMEQALVLCSVRIVTDMRPVFDDEASEMEGVLPFHTLVLKCHESDRMDEHKNIYVAIDAPDLRDLREQIDRAERKEQIMRKKLDSDGYNIVGFSTASDETEAG